MKTQTKTPARKLDRSKELLRRAEKVIPGCSQTFSKAPNQFVRGVSPAFLERAKGSHVWDVDGNEYLDYSLALGPIILGYADPDVDAAVKRQLEKGTIFSLPHPLEVEVAEKICELVPCAEMVRFGKNGSDVTAAAVRASRAFTGREKVACCGYHGWQDWYIGTTTRSGGVPKAVRELTLTFQYNDPGSLETLFRENPGQIACVVLEPIGVVDPKPGFLEAVAEIARRNGALLVFDEVVTGFRVSLGGAQEHYRVTPDLACFGKALANGYPLAAVAGRRDVMMKFNDLFYSSTFGGEALSLAAASATLAKLKAKKALAQIWKQGEKLRDGFNRLAAEAGLGERLRCIGLPPHTVISFKDVRGADSLAVRSLFQQELVKRGILFLVGFNVSWSHDDKDVARTLDACREALAVVADAGADPESRLEGPMVEAVFRKP